jgi:ABC-type multidrug transport system ATPase subunit
MMMISLSDAGKRFNRDWIFRHFNYNFELGKSYAITGPNGSGKSTLLQVLSGGMSINEGSIEWTVSSRESGACLPDRQVESRESAVNKASNINANEIYRYISIAAPYLEVVEEMTLREFLLFHNNFKPYLPGITVDSIISTIGLEKAENKQIRYYSSGMKQRVKLAQCIFSDSAIVLLDEPCTNLDAAGIELYHSLISTYCKDRLVLVSSNDEVEYNFCKEKISINDFKK